jgi:hypothetical protein
MLIGTNDEYSRRDCVDKQEDNWSFQCIVFNGNVLH